MFFCVKMTNVFYYSARGRGTWILGLIRDAKTIAKRDPAARNAAEVFFLYPGFHALIYYRISSFFYRCHMKFIARWVSQIGSRRTGVEIHPGAKIGSGLVIDHGHGIVIGETAVIGDNCTIYHQVTLGGNGREKNAKRHPTVGNNVLIGAGAKILGPVTIGDHSQIGAGSVVLIDVPECSTVAGVKARVIKRQGEKIPPENEPSVALEHNKVQDPVAQEMAQLKQQIEEMQKKLDRIDKQER